MKNEVIRRPHVARLAAAFLLIGAVLPGATYVGHVPGEGAAHTHVEEHSQDGGEEHALHCHTGPSSCAGAQAMVGALWVGEDPGLIAPAPETRSSRDSTDIITPEAPVIRILEPPRTA